MSCETWISIMNHIPVAEIGEISLPLERHDADQVLRPLSWLRVVGHVDLPCTVRPLFFPPLVAGSCSCEMPQLICCLAVVLPRGSKLARQVKRARTPLTGRAGTLFFYEPRGGVTAGWAVSECVSGRRETTRTPTDDAPDRSRSRSASLADDLLVRRPAGSRPP